MPENWKERDSGGSGGDNNEQLTQPQPITTSPTIEPLNELMKTNQKKAQ